MYRNQCHTEHSEAEIFRYVHERELIRPRFSIPKLAAWMVVTVVVAFLSSSVLNLYNVARPYLWGTVAALFLMVRRLVIATVQVYQRYSPEDVRRSCMLMPTCSEYCILAVRKYGALIGCTMTLYRLLFKCRGQIYREDWP